MHIIRSGALITIKETRIKAGDQKKLMVETQMEVIIMQGKTVIEMEKSNILNVVWA